MSEELEQIQQIKKQAEAAVAAGNFAQALQTAIQGPSGSDDASKRIATATVSSILANVKEADIAKLLDGMSEEDRSTVMKYVYRGMETGQNCAPLLKWHASIFEKDGQGAIMRVLCDRK